jgi:sugar lactone lactonase YvrE
LPRPAPGDPLPRIQCPPGYTAKVYASNLTSPDGLAISPAGILHVAEEGAGRVSQIDATGSVTPVLSGLQDPEGITFDPQTGALYVVEDVEDGRLIERAADGTITTLASGLEAPEGVTWASDGTLYLTEANIQYASLVDLRTRVAAFSPPATLTRVITDTPEVSGTLVHAWSYAGITGGLDGRLYVTNELSGLEITRTVVLIPGILTTTVTLTTTDSVFAVDPEAGTRELLASGLTTPEGLHFAPGGGFPLYVTEEDTGSGAGRISAIESDGRHAPLCTGFMTVEDVIVDADGTLYVSEDGSGMVIAIERETVPLRAGFGGSPRTGIAPLTVAFTNTSSGDYQTLLWDLGDEHTSLLEHPTHTYQAPGSYTVTLTIVGPAGSDSRTKTNYISALWGTYLPLILREM